MGKFAHLHNYEDLGQVVVLNLIHPGPQAIQILYRYNDLVFDAGCAAFSEQEIENEFLKLSDAEYTHHVVMDFQADLQRQAQLLKHS